MEVKGEVKKIVKALQALSVKIEQLPPQQASQQLSVSLYRDVSALLKRIIVSYCMSDMDNSRYNSLVQAIEGSIALLRQKDQGFDVRFDRKNVVENIIREYSQVTYVVASGKPLNDWEDHAAIKTAEETLAFSFRERLLGIQYLNHTSGSLVIHVPEEISFDAILS